MFLPFGRNNIIGTYEMLPQCIERIPKMNGVSKTYSTIPISILMVVLSKTAKRNDFSSSKDGCRTCPKEPSPQMIKRPLATVVLKDPQSYQLVKTDHVENAQEGQSEPL